MTAKEWLECNDPTPMLELLRPQASERKLRLFASGICRRHQKQMAISGLSERLDAVERYADGLISLEELTAVSQRHTTPSHFYLRANRVQQHARHVLWRLTQYHEPMFTTVTVALQGFSAKKKAIQRGRTRLLREIFGNPFRPIAVDPSWLTPTVLQFANHIYDDRDFAQMPILADALQDAGCEDTELLAHCRGPGPHVRGCWVVDLVLGKE